jgi:hypothetical protein
MNHAVGSLEISELKIRERIEKQSAKYTPTSYDRFREISEFVWWLIAWDAKADALRILNAMCELDDDTYWVFQALASALATRAWLYVEMGEEEQSLIDAQSALEWLKQEPNFKAITKAEIEDGLKRFDQWMERALSERGHATAAHVISHALRVLIIYQQIGKAGCQPAQSFRQEEFTARMESALAELKNRLASF